MTRTLRLLAASLLLTAALCVHASAADFEPVAQELSAIGLFQGTASGLDLDRAPTRSEAAVMLVRLYGAEDTACAAYADGALSHPFTDVPAYAAPHVAWLYEQGLVKGVSESRFGGSDLCSAQSYTTLLLRVLGYADGRDFTYENALAFAEEKGFYTPLMFSGEFLRNDLAALTYQALATDTAGGDTYLLAQLVENGTVSLDAAAPMMEKMELLREMSRLERSVSGAVELDARMEIQCAPEGALPEYTGTMEGTVKTILIGDALELSYDMTSRVEETTVHNAVWLKDNRVYQRTESSERTQSIQYPTEDHRSVLEALNVPAIPSVSGIDVFGLAMTDSVTKKTKGRETVYTVTFAEGFDGHVSAPEESENEHMSVGKITVIYTADRRGNLSGIGFRMPYTITMDVSGESIVYQYSTDMFYTVKATGDAVKISYPDFSAFAEAGALQ